MVNFNTDLITIPKAELTVYKCFVVYCCKELDIEAPVNIIFLPAKNDLGITTGGYDRTDKVFCRVENRALIDCCRTIAHELVHMSQKLSGAFKSEEVVQDIGGPIEDEANAVAGQLIKKFVKDIDCRWIYEI